MILLLFRFFFFFWWLSFIFFTYLNIKTLIARDLIVNNLVRRVIACVNIFDLALIIIPLSFIAIVKNNFNK